MTLTTELQNRAASTEVARTEQHMTVFDLIERNKAEIARALPNACTPERFVRIVTTALRMTPELQTCTAASLMGAVMLCAQCGLEPGPLQHAYLVPFKDHGVPKVTLIVGYQGLVDLGYRSPHVASIVGRAVKEGDTFECDFGLNERLVHIPAKGERGRSIAYYVIVRLAAGGHVMHAMSRADIEEHRKVSRIRDSGPWRTNYDPMAIKTVLRVMSPWIPKSIDFARALASDEMVTETIEPDLADSTAYIDVDPDPDDDGPRGAGHPPADEPQDGKEVDGPESLQDQRGDEPAPSTTTVTNEHDASTSPAPSAPGRRGNDASAGAGSSSTSSSTENTARGGATPDDAASPAPLTDASKVAMWCADAGIGDDRRPALLHAFSNGAYTSAKDIPADELGPLRTVLDDLKAGRVRLVYDPGHGAVPVLRGPDDTSEASGPEPAAVLWRAEVAKVKGVGPAKLLTHARTLAAEQELELPRSIDEIPAVLNVPLFAWLREHPAA